MAAEAVGTAFLLAAVVGSVEGEQEQWLKRRQ
jgi:hypothetical protein